MVMCDYFTVFTNIKSLPCTYKTNMCQLYLKYIIYNTIKCMLLRKKFHICKICMEKIINPIERHFKDLNRWK